MLAMVAGDPIMPQSILHGLKLYAVRWGQLTKSRAGLGRDCCRLWCSSWESAWLWARRLSGTSGPGRARRRAACCSCWRLPLSWS